MPLFNCREPSDRISNMSASYVEIIHTNGNHLGMQKPIGHSDFYVNGGISQPKCDESFIEEYLLKGPLFERFRTAAVVILLGFIAEEIPNIICSHLMVVLLYAESINSKTGFYGKKCNIKESKLNEIELEPQDCGGDFVLMGGSEITPVKQGIFYLKTKKSFPFALGKR